MNWRFHRLLLKLSIKFKIGLKMIFYYIKALTASIALS